MKPKQLLLLVSSGVCSMHNLLLQLGSQGLKDVGLELLLLPRAPVQAGAAESAVARQDVHTAGLPTAAVPVSESLVLAAAMPGCSCCLTNGQCCLAGGAGRRRTA